MATRYSGQIVTDGLVLALDASSPRSYTSGSSVWYDLSGNGNHCTLYNTPSFTTEYNGGISFNGTNQYGVIIDNSTIDFGTGDFSVGIVFKVNSIPGWESIVGNGASGANGWSITMDSNGYYSMDIDAPDNTHRAIRSLSNNTLYMTHGNFDRDGNASGYFDGSYVAGSSISSQNQTVDNASGNLTIGAYFTTSSWYFYGTIYSVLLYNRVLTAAEILQNYNATKGRFL